MVFGKTCRTNLTPNVTHRLNARHLTQTPRKPGFPERGVCSGFQRKGGALDDCLFAVACSQHKHRDLERGAIPAQRAYTNQCFRLARQWCIVQRAKWCILSGLYGFRWPDTPIEHYDQKMEPLDERDFMAFNAIKQKQYGRLYAARRVIVLGSRLYPSVAAGLLERDVEAPLAGLSIGKMLALLSRAEFFRLPPRPSIYCLDEQIELLEVAA